MKTAAAIIGRFKKSLPVALAVSLISFFSPLAQGYDLPSDQNLAFTILHTNDIHSHNDSFTEGGRQIGGMPRIAHLIKTLKRSNNKVLAIDAGDIFQGTPYFEQYHGQAEIECLNKAGYDIYTIGNHEFDDGAANLGKQLERAKFDVINTNLDFGPHANMKSIVKPSTVKTIDGQKVGFVGVITPELSALTTKLEGVQLKASGSNWLAPVKAEIERLKAGGINKIVVVSHCGIEYEKAMAEAIPDIDVIIGGHSHTRLDKPIIVKHEDGSACYIVQTGCYTRALGRLDLVFDKQGQVVPETKYRLINITGRIFEDPDLKSYVDEMGKPFAYLRTTICGTAEANFDNRFKSYPWDSPIGDLICDALVDAGAPAGATIALQNRGGIRGKIEHGPISLERIKEILPFENHLIFATISGDTLLKVLENSVSGSLGARFLDVKGLKFAYDPSQESGKRIAFALALNKEGQWQPIQVGDSYRIAINSYSFGGGESYDFSKAKDVVDTGKRLSIIMQAYLEKKKRVRPEPPSRFLAVIGDKTTLQTKNGKRELVVQLKDAAGSEVTLVQGTGQGVEFLPQVGVVPLANARIIATGKLDHKSEFRRVIDSGRKVAKGKRPDNNNDSWLAFVIRTREDGPFKRVVTTPVCAGDK